MKNIIYLLVSIVVIWLSAAVSHAKDWHKQPNHPFSHVEINYLHEGCSFSVSTVDFCDKQHITAIKKAISTDTVNFNNHYILLKIKEWSPSEYYGNSLVVIDSLTGVAYPMPFDYYAGWTDMNNGRILRKPKLFFSKESNQICVDGAILVYRATINGKFCFKFDGSKFTGYHTEYMIN